MKKDIAIETLERFTDRISEDDRQLFMSALDALRPAKKKQKKFPYVAFEVKFKDGYKVKTGTYSNDPKECEGFAIWSRQIEQARPRYKWQTHTDGTMRRKLIPIKLPPIVETLRLE